VVIVTEPVYDAAGKLLFVLGGAIDLRRPRFFGQLEALKSGRSGYLFMLTKQGTLIHHPDKERILQNVTEEQGGPLPTTLAAMNGFEGTVDGKSRRGVPALITFKQLLQTDWIIGAVYPVDEAFAPLIAMRKKALFASAAVAAAAGLLGWLAILRLLRPLGALRKHVARNAEGSENIDVFDVARKDEFGELSRAFFALSQQRRDAEANLTTLTRTDPLTGIHNRRMFEEIFAAALERSRRNRRGLGLAYLDIDRFKHINDTYGHGVGDVVLIEFASRLKHCVRVTDSVARLAGDEFVVVFENLSSDAEAAGLATKMLDAMRPEFDAGDVVLPVSASVGIALDMGGKGAATEFLEQADKALYEAKEAGRNRFAVRLLSSPDCPPQRAQSV
jgi:diguanylate cyclase (GGDEF)-like protein